MNNIDNVIATVTEKVLEKPISSFSTLKFNLTFPDLLSILIIFAIAYGLFVLFKLLMAWQVRRDKVRKSQSKTLSQLAGYVITVVAVAAAFSSVGYSLTYFLVGSTALLVGVGFGLQQILVDLISGVILLIDKNINYGDVIRVDLPSTQSQMSGRIVNIGLRTTLLETIDNEMMIVPNSKMLQSGVKSLMRGNGAARFRVCVGVSYESDMEKAKLIVTKAVLSHPKIEEEPKPTIILKSFDESGVTLEVRFWMKELFNSENILSDVRFAILDSFRKDGISIPYPHRVITEKK